MKKILTYITAGVLSVWLFANAVWAQTTNVELVNKTGNFTVSTDTILIGKTNVETAAKDLFSEIELKGTKITDENFTNNIDVRYLSGTVDNKVFTPTDKIPAGAETFVLFKAEADGGLVSKDTPIKVTTNNLTLEAFAKVDPTGKNKYIETGKFTYSSQLPGQPTPPEQKPIVEEPAPVDTDLLKDTKAGIFDNSLVLFWALIVLWALFVIPNRRKD